MDRALETSELSRTFGEKPAVDGLTMYAERGEVLALLGPNGAGKTTTVRLLNGVLAPTAGSSDVLGFDPSTQGDELRRHTGVLTENAGLDDRLTARENLELAALMRGFSADIARARVTELLRHFGMLDAAEFQTQGFSTGQRKRIALARALLHDPEVLFLDEPTSGLDPKGTRDVVDLIGWLAREQGRTIVLCTHFLGEADRLADRLAFLDRGRPRAFGRPADLARELWPGLGAEIDLGRPADTAEAATIKTVTGITSVTPTDFGATVTIEHRSQLPELHRALVEAAVDVFGVTPKPPTLEDLYFALEQRITADPDFTLLASPAAAGEEPAGAGEEPAGAGEDPAERLTVRP
ncbi:MAG: ABC transporter ATP-binding protein [Acidimicrobiales bacterium]|nr:ABC transporter ATP-binding protein [Acidimicrobiales bacterium]